MDHFEVIVSMPDFTLNSKRKRYVAGGILVSVLMIFRGLAITDMTLRTEEEKE